MKRSGLALKVLLMVAVVASLTTCATIISGGEQRVNISSAPSEAAIKITDSSGMVVFNSQTPTVAVLKRGQGWFQGASYRVSISKQGYKTQDIIIQSSLNGGWYIVGNFFLGGLIGWLIVDPLTGAMWTLSPENLDTQLSTTTSSLPQGGDISIALLKDIPAALLPQLQPVFVPESE